MPSVLYTASTFSHILNFHLPYLRRFRELGWQVEVACGGPVRDIPFADGAVSLPLEKRMSSPVMGSPLAKVIPSFSTTTKVSSSS